MVLENSLQVLEDDNFMIKCMHWYEEVESHIGSAPHE